LILAGQVLVSDQRVDKPGTLIDLLAEIRLKQTERYVSRGGIKLEGALRQLDLDPQGKTCVDVGASTGGFTDCLLQHGASRVYAVDVGQGLLAQKLVVDARVVVMDKTNARHLERQHFDTAIDWVVVDASFIGIGQLIGAIASVLPSGGLLLAMIKPQFEVGRELARRAKGVIKDPAVRQQAIDTSTATIQHAGFHILGGCESTLAGPKGNVEYFVHAVRIDAALPAGSED
jgi:23S rRNA (cytidine1920-2'-O)/16S rRNA (cytidine1409-2'-O)-methyltransferase